MTARLQPMIATSRMTVNGIRWQCRVTVSPVARLRRGRGGARVERGRARRGPPAIPHCHSRPL
jgi:hypothetical protein